MQVSQPGSIALAAAFAILRIAQEIVGLRISVGSELYDKSSKAFAFPPHAVFSAVAVPFGQTTTAARVTRATQYKSAPSR